MNFVKANLNKLFVLFSVFFFLILSDGCVGQTEITLNPPVLKNNPDEVANLLSNKKIWVMPQPKAVGILDGKFNLNKCGGIQFLSNLNVTNDFSGRLSTLLKERSNVTLKILDDDKVCSGSIILGLFSDGKVPEHVTAFRDADIADIGEQGYVLRIDPHNVAVVATTESGLRYAVDTLVQIAADKTVIPALHIKDWPSLKYRGIMYDISRGQMPKLETLKRLARISAEAKLNILELYIEDMFKWRNYPDIAPPEALTPLDCRDLSNYASGYGIDVYPFIQVLGHFHKIGSKPAYKHLMVPVPEGGTEGHLWTTTVDVRNPQAVAFVMDLVKEVCQAFPGKFISVDITEIADYGFIKSGTKAEDIPKLMLDYVIKIHDTVSKYDKQLMLAQSKLDATGHLNGLGQVIDDVPKNVIVTSYYTAEFYGGWDKDYPLLQQKNIGFFAQPWIDAHGHIMPYVGHACDFSDVTVSRGLKFGAMGSVTCDWGDDGHYHLPGMTWYPFLYHGASAWTGAMFDRDYFDRAFCRQIFGVADDGVAKAIKLIGNINGQDMKIRNAEGQIVDIPYYFANARYGYFYHEFFADPFTDKWILQIVEPGQKGREIEEPALEAVTLLRNAREQVNRNCDMLEVLLFAAENYQAMGRKLIVRQHFLDENVPREDVAAELDELAAIYTKLKNRFSRLWLVECKDAGSFRKYLQRFDQTITPCREKAQQLRGTK